MKKYILVLTLVMIFSAIFSACGNSDKPEEPEEEDNAVVEESPATDETMEDTNASETNTSENTYKDGTYEAEGEGYTDKISVSVTVEQGKISDITVINDMEGNIGTKVFPDMTGAMISANSPSVDAVSGATVTSNGFKEAVILALEQAK